MKRFDARKAVQEEMVKLGLYRETKVCCVRVKRGVTDFEVKPTAKTFLGRRFTRACIVSGFHIILFFGFLASRSTDPAGN